MQHLLGFLYEHSFDKQLYCVLPSEHGELQLTWCADTPQTWQVRRVGAQSSEQVQRVHLIAFLSNRGADLMIFERELMALVAAHVVVADQLLAAARSTLGGESVNEMLHGHEAFARELKQALTSALPPRLRLVR